MRRKLGDKNTRKIFRSGSSYAITLPVELVNELNWREKQKVAVQKKGNYLIIKDWKK